MFHPLDIFRTEPDGHVLWLGAAESFAAAKARIEKLERSSPGEYLIIDQMTGHKVCLTLGISTPASSVVDASTTVECVVRAIQS
jgi:sarcosine oxidase gamma subunit